MLFEVQYYLFSERNGQPTTEYEEKMTVMDVDEERIDEPGYLNGKISELTGEKKHLIKAISVTEI